MSNEINSIDNKLTKEVAKIHLERLRQMWMDCFESSDDKWNETVRFEEESPLGEQIEGLEMPEYDTPFLEKYDDWDMNEYVFSLNLVYTTLRFMAEKNDLFSEEFDEELIRDLKKFENRKWTHFSNVENGIYDFKSLIKPKKINRGNISEFLNTKKIFCRFCDSTVYFTDSIASEKDIEKMFSEGHLTVSDSMNLECSICNLSGEPKHLYAILKNGESVNLNDFLLYDNDITACETIDEAIEIYDLIEDNEYSELNEEIRVKLNQIMNGRILTKDEELAISNHTLLIDWIRLMIETNYLEVYFELNRLAQDIQELVDKDYLSNDEMKSILEYVNSKVYELINE